MSVTIYSIKKQTFINNYQLIKYLSSGSSCKVYLVELQETKYVLKIYNHISIMNSIVSVTKIIDEYVSLPHIIEYFRVEDVKNTSNGSFNIQVSYGFLVEQYIEGYSIAQYCLGLPIIDKLKLFRILCEQVQVMHKMHVYHFDLKPDNILVDENGSVFIIDFGASQIGSPQMKRYQYTKGFSGVDQVYDEDTANKEDIHELGEIGVVIFTGRSQQTLAPFFRNTAQLKLSCGYLVADLLNGMTSSIIQYSLYAVIAHPAFNKSHCTKEQQLLIFSRHSIDYSSHKIRLLQRRFSEAARSGSISYKLTQVDIMQTGDDQDHCVKVAQIAHRYQDIPLHYTANHMQSYMLPLRQYTTLRHRTGKILDEQCIQIENFSFESEHQCDMNALVKGQISSAPSATNSTASLFQINTQNSEAYDSSDSLTVDVKFKPGVTTHLPGITEIESEDIDLQPDVQLFAGAYVQAYPIETKSDCDKVSSSNAESKTIRLFDDKSVDEDEDHL